MLYEKLLVETDEEGLSEESRKERIKELQEFIQAQSHLYDDHGSVIIGSRDGKPKLEE